MKRILLFLAAALTVLSAGAAAPSNSYQFDNASISVPTGFTGTVRQVGTMGAARTVTLPPASSVPAGAVVIVQDISCTASASLTITAIGAGSDSILGPAVINSACGGQVFSSDGVSKWGSVGTSADALGGLAVKPPVALVADSNLTLSGAQTVDGVAGTAGQTIVLATAQLTGSQNGPWVMQSGAWTRPSWYASGNRYQAIQFNTTFVRLGTLYQGTTWRMTTSGAVTIDTTATTWVETPMALNQKSIASVVGASKAIGIWRGVKLGCFGDSRCAGGYYDAAAGSYGTYPLTYTAGRGITQWAQFFSRGLISLDYSSGYTAQYSAGAVKFTVTAGGTGYTNPTITEPDCTGTPGAVTLLGGAITDIAIGKQTGTCSASPEPLTITDATGTGAAAFATVTNGGSLAGSGENTTQILARLNDACNDGNDAELVIAGTNDLTTSVPVATTKANLQAIAEGLMKCGKFVVMMTQAPRSQTAITAAQQLVLYQIDNWIRSYVREEQAQNPSGYSNINILDTTPIWLDASSSTGAPLTNCFYDATHPASGCAMTAGYILFQILQARFGLYGLSEGTARNDLYDATNNPFGALNTSPYMAASGGTVNSPCTGSIATGYTLSRSGSASTTCTASLEGAAASGTRSDGYSGSRQVLVVSAGSGTSTEHYVIFTPNTTTASLGVNTGDKLWAQVDMELSGTTKLNQIYMDLKCLDSGNTVVAKAVAGRDGQDDVYPDSTALGGFTTSRPFTLITKKPGFTVPSTCSKLAMDISIGVDASGGAASAGFTAKWTNWAIRKM